jgi:hypothetical protein
MKKGLETRKADPPTLTGALSCPYPGHNELRFQTLEQLYNHAKTEHELQLKDLWPSHARDDLKNALLAVRYEMSRVEFTHHAKISPGKLMAH